MIRQLLEHWRNWRNPQKGTFAYRHQQIPGKRGPDYFHRLYYVLRQNDSLRSHAMFEGIPEVPVFHVNDEADNGGGS